MLDPVTGHDIRQLYIDNHSELIRIKDEVKKEMGYAFIGREVVRIGRTGQNEKFETYAARLSKHPIFMGKKGGAKLVFRWCSMKGITLHSFDYTPSPELFDKGWFVRGRRRNSAYGTGWTNISITQKGRMGLLSVLG